MTYEEYVKEIELKNGEISELDKNILLMERTIQGKNRELTEKDNTKEDKIKEAKFKALQEYEKNIALPFETQIAELENKKKELKFRRDEILKDIDSKDYSKKYSSKINIEEESKVCEEVDSIIEKFYGKELSENLESVIIDNLDSKDDIKNIIPNLRHASSILDKSFNVEDKFEGFFSVFQYNTEAETAVNNAQMFGASLLCIIFLGIGLWAYPVLVIGLVVCLGYNIIKSNTFIKCMSYTKAFKTYKNDITNLASKYVNDAVKRDKDRAEDLYKSCCSKVEDDIRKLQQACELEIEKNRQNFVFNPDSIEEDFRVVKENIKSSRERLEEDVAKSKEKLKILESELEELKMGMENSLKTLIGEYMPNKLKLGNFLPENILLDIVGTKPVFFKLPKESCLFVYEDIESLNNFILLLYTQIISTIRPDYIQFDLLDQTYMGESLIFFSKDDSVSIATDKKDIKSLCDGLLLNLKDRQKFMVRYKDIVEYNKALLDLDCPCEPYHFIFNIVQDASELEDDVLEKIRVNGNRYGYIEFAFISKKGYLESKDNLIDILEYIENCFFLNDRGVIKRPKDFLINEIKKSK